MDIWQLCEGERQVRPLRGRLLRMVESHAQVATLQLVDNLAEQALLEELLESSKPPLPEAAEPLHYLLKTPFRYPPLRWGSRFGSVHEPSLFYAAQRLETAMAEAAYYRFVLWNGMATPPPSGRILSEHSTFEARYRVERGIQLQQPPSISMALCWPTLATTACPSASAQQCVRPVFRPSSIARRAARTAVAMSRSTCRPPSRKNGRVT